MLALSIHVKACIEAATQLLANRARIVASEVFPGLTIATLNTFTMVRELGVYLSQVQFAGGTVAKWPLPESSVDAEVCSNLRSRHTVEMSLGPFALLSNDIQTAARLFSILSLQNLKMCPVRKNFVTIRSSFPAAADSSGKVLKAAL